MGGQNSQDSILERRSLVWNDDGVVDRADYPILGTDAVYKGKFFTRGCRGMIEEIQIWRTATAGGTITLRMSPHPCLGPLYEVIIPIGAANAWTGVALEEMWNYDSLFIWVHALEAGEEWGYDAAQPYDGHESGDVGATWADMAIRPFIRAVYTGETPGDVPVSGIINNIPIPNISSGEIHGYDNLVMGFEAPIVDIHGAGYVKLWTAWIGAQVDSHLTQLRVYCDDVMVFDRRYSTMNGNGLDGYTQPLTVPLYAVDGTVYMMISHKWEFRRRFEIRALNTANDITMVSVFVYPTLMR